MSDIRAYAPVFRECQEACLMQPRAAYATDFRFDTPETLGDYRGAPMLRTLRSSRTAYVDGHLDGVSMLQAQADFEVTDDVVMAFMAHERASRRVLFEDSKAPTPLFVGAGVALGALFLEGMMVDYLTKRTAQLEVFNDRALDTPNYFAGAFGLQSIAATAVVYGAFGSAARLVANHRLRRVPLTLEQATSAPALTEALRQEEVIRSQRRKAIRWAAVPSVLAGLGIGYASAAAVAG